MIAIHRAPPSVAYSPSNRRRPVASTSWSSVVTASSPRSATSRPRASSRWYLSSRRSAACTISASAASRRSASPPRRSSVSNVQSSPAWPSSAPTTSNGIASAGSASAGANRNSASGSTKRLMSQAEAMRSTCGRGRVTQRRPRSAPRGAGGAGAGAARRPPRPAALERVEEPPIALGEAAVVVVARVVEQAPQRLRRHVLDAVHLEQRRLAAVALDLLVEPLELLVALRGEGEHPDRVLQRDRAERAEAAPGAHAPARGLGG